MEVNFTNFIVGLQVVFKNLMENLVISRRYLADITFVHLVYTFKTICFLEIEAFATGFFFCYWHGYAEGEFFIERFRNAKIDKFHWSRSRYACFPHFCQ